MHSKLIKALANSIRIRPPYSVRTQYIPENNHGGPSHHLVVLINKSFPALLRVVALEDGFYVFREYADIEEPYFYAYESPNCVEELQREIYSVADEESCKRTN